MDVVQLGWRIGSAVVAGAVGFAAVTAGVGISRSKSRVAKRDSQNAQPAEPITSANLEKVIQSLRATFQDGVTRDIEWRREQLENLRDMVRDNRDAIIQAVAKDLGKHAPYQEVIVSEVNLILCEIDEALAHLDSWTKPTRVYTPISAQPATSEIRHDPLGVVLVVAPWNYPFNLAIAPLIGSITAGNATLVKASRHSPNTAKILVDLLGRYMDRRAVRCEGEGGASFLTELLTFQFDHIFFTGSVSVGKVVAAAAAKFLTPCTLELGGKNPCIVLSDADLKLAAKRIAWGKFFNAGQTCLGVDHVLVDRSVHDAFVREIKAAIEGFYGADPETSTSFPRIISVEHAKRLEKTFKDGTVIHGGKAKPDQKYVSPTVIVNPKPNTPLMCDEIFGPVLPIVAIDGLDEAVQWCRERPLPLALYVFTTNPASAEAVLSRTRSGAALVNDVILHFANSNLPFGGVGDSGLGRYHGKFSFDTLTHKRATIWAAKRAWMDLPLRYPPYSTVISKLVDFATRLGW